VPGAEHPGRGHEEEELADGDGCVVERVLGHRVRDGQREEHGDGGHPEHADPADERAVAAQVEGPRREVLARQRHAEQDRQRVRDVQPDRRDRHHRLERHQAAQRLHADPITNGASRSAWRSITARELDQEAKNLIERAGLPAAPCRGRRRPRARRR
jgi:hypothetical protein